MTNFVGNRIGGSPGHAESGNTELRQTFYNANFYPGGNGTAYTGAVDGIYPECGTITSNPQNQFPVNHGGCKVNSYVAIFYGRVTLEPNPLAVGNIVSEVTREVVLWNGYFVSRTLDSLVGSNVDGILIDGGSVPPTVLAPLESIVYTITILATEGPPTIDGSYFFTFTTIEDNKELLITGSRILPLPYLFQAGLVEAINWNTKVLTSHNGYEQRLRLRNAPRQEFNFNVGIPRNQIAQLNSLIYGWRRNNFGLPVSSECRPLDTTATAGDTVLNVSTLYGDFREGGLAMIYSSIDAFELLEVDTLTASTMTIAAGLANNYTTRALVMPVRTAVLVDNPVRHTTGDWQKLQARFRCTDNIVIPNAASVIQYKGLDVYLDLPLLLNGFVADVYTDRIDNVDYQVGLTTSFAPWLKPKIQRTFGIQLDNLEDVWTFRQWLHRRGGKFRPFWMPTFETDFTSTAVGFLTTQLLVKDEGQLGLTTGRDDMALDTTNGWVFAEIESIAAFGAGELIVTFTSALNIEADTIIMLCYLGRKRLLSDNIEIVWKGNNTAQTSLPILEINN